MKETFVSCLCIALIALSTTTSAELFHSAVENQAAAVDGGTMPEFQPAVRGNSSYWKRTDAIPGIRSSAVSIRKPAINDASIRPAVIAASASGQYFPKLSEETAGSYPSSSAHEITIKEGQRIPAPPVSESAALLLFGAGLAGVASMTRKNREKSAS